MYFGNVLETHLVQQAHRQSENLHVTGFRTTKERVTAVGNQKSHMQLSLPNVDMLFVSLSSQLFFFFFRSMERIWFNVSVIFLRWSIFRQTHLKARFLDSPSSYPIYLCVLWILPFRVELWLTRNGDTIVEDRAKKVI